MIRQCLITIALLTGASAVSGLAPDQPARSALAAETSAADRDEAAHPCRPEAGFRRALAGEEDPGACQDRDFRIDFELGRNLKTLREEQAALRSALAASETDPATSRAHHARLQVIERELQQIEGLARIRGLLPGKHEHPR